jgi:hypothetical protein
MRGAREPVPAPTEQEQETGDASANWTEKWNRSNAFVNSSPTHCAT